MVSADERRVELRGARDERLFIKVRSGEQGSELLDTTIGCSTEDVSASGLRLLLEQNLSKGTLLELWIEIKGIPGKFLLHGVVRWSEGRIDEQYLCGVELYEEDEPSDLAEWQELFS